MITRKDFTSLFLNEEGKYMDYISETAFDKLRQMGGFKLFLPEELNGLSYSLSQTLNVFRELSYCNGSLGWLVQIGNGGNYFVTNCSDQTNKRFFFSKDSLLTGSALVGGMGAKIEGGFVISGQWRYASGSDYATVFTATLTLEGREGVWTALVPREDVTIIKDWDTLGMRQTSSHSFKVEQVFIPDEHFFQTSVRKNYLETPLFNLPFFVYAQVFFTATLYGLVERLLEEGCIWSETKLEVWRDYAPNRLNRFQELSEDASKWLKSTLELMENVSHKCEDSFSFDEEEMSLIFKKNAQTVKVWAHDWFSLYGMDVLDQKHVINIFYRDLLTLTQHGLFQI